MSLIGKSYKKTVELRLGNKSDVEDVTLITLTNPDSTEDFTHDRVTFKASFSGQKTITVLETPFTITNEDIILVDTDAVGALAVVNLPMSSDRFNIKTNTGSPVTIKNIGVIGTFNVNVVPNGLEEVEFTTDAIILKPDSLTLSPDGTDWWIV